MFFVFCFFVFLFFLGEETFFWRLSLSIFGTHVSSCFLLLLLMSCYRLIALQLPSLTRRVLLLVFVGELFVCCSSSAAATSSCCCNKRKIVDCRSTLSAESKHLVDSGAQPFFLFFSLPSFLFFLFSLVFWTDEAQKDEECIEEEEQEEGRRRKKKGERGGGGGGGGRRRRIQVLFELKKAHKAKECSRRRIRRRTTTTTRRRRRRQERIE